MNHFLSIQDLSKDDALYLLAEAARMKSELREHPDAGMDVLRGKTLALVFEKPSLRTRVSFDVGMYQLGGHAISLSPSEIGLGKRESVADVARVLGDPLRVYSLSGALRAGATTPLEISGAINRSDGAAANKGTNFSLGAKYLFSREADAIGVRTAAGIGYSEFDVVRNYHVYAVATKYFGTVTGERVPITGHLGVRYDRFEAFGVNSNRPSIYAGAEVPLTRTGEFQVLGEFGTKVVSGGASPYSIGVRFRPRQQPFGATIGLQRQGILDSSGRLFAQVGYTFGGR